MQQIAKLAVKFATQAACNRRRSCFHSDCAAGPYPLAVVIVRLLKARSQLAGRSREDCVCACLVLSHVVICCYTALIIVVMLLYCGCGPAQAQARSRGFT